MAAAVIADDGANVFGDRIDVAQQVFEGLLVQLGMFVERSIQVVDVRLVVLAVVNLHRLRVDVRLQGREVVRQSRKRVRHVPPSLKIVVL